MIASTLDHQVPPGFSVVELKICENCGWPFERDRGATAKLGPNCWAALYTPGNQLWMCSDCGAFRSYGHGNPELTADKQLKCNGCAGPTRHRFWKVS